MVNASRIIEASLKNGLALEQIFLDPLVFPIAVDGDYGRHCLEAISQLRQRFGDTSPHHRRDEQRELRTPQQTAFE